MTSRQSIVTAINLILFSSIFTSAQSGPVSEGRGSRDDMPLLKDPYHLSLARTVECSTDINRICGSGIVRDNFQAISCLQDGHKDFDISEPCQHLIWNYKRNLTIDPKYENAVQTICSSMIQKIGECRDLSESKGHLIPCLIEYMDNSSLVSHHCQSFLNRLKPVVFSDYRIIYKFSEACHKDIETLKCGRMDVDEDEYGEKALHQQGKVLTCLAKGLQSLSDVCKHELLRVAELQADDYHNDRQLFFACRNDREKFCARVESGEGRVYKCLFKYKMDPEMSNQCREMLVLRQRMEQEDYRVNVGLAKSCQKDIIDNHCVRHLDRVASFNNARMSAVLLCLEATIKDGRDIKPECRSEMKDVRRSLMEDYRISPSLVVDCSKEIETHCGGNIQRNGKTIHCLLDLARPKIKSDKKEFSKDLSPICARSLELLMMQADVAENIEIDPILREACDSVVRAYCSNILPGEGRILTCLADSLDQPKMTDECKQSLMEIQYFIDRDFRLDPQLYQHCKVDAAKLCHAPSRWFAPDGDREAFDVEQGYLVFACLYRHIDKTSDEPKYRPLSRSCATEVRRVMRERAVSVNLDPAVESECLSDLSIHCIDKFQKNEEMDCLEDNLEKLSPGCKKVISEFIENTDKDPTINDIFLRVCEPFWQRHCEGGNQKLTMDIIDESFEEQLMACLIVNKNHPSMDARCRAGVEHHQIVTLKNFRFSHKFKQSCAEDASKYCKEREDKWYVINCLSEVVLNDTLLNNKKPRLSMQCRKQLNFELLQRSEDILLDPELRDVCRGDVQKYCSEVQHGQAAVIQCLINKLKKLSTGCHRKLFKRLEIESLNPKSDYFLYNKCKAMIKKHCVTDLSSPELLFACLQKNQEEDDFDEKCKEAVLSRAHIMGKDIRLNRELSRVCYSDVMEFCRKEMSGRDEEMEDDGRVIECLRRVFIGRDKKAKLTETCENHIKILIRMSAEDFKLDVALNTACVNEIATMCSEASKLNYGSQTDRGNVEGCLKDALKNNMITHISNPNCHKQIERLIEESIVDVHADTKLSRFCSIDLKSHCFDVPKGEGRQLDCLLTRLLEKPNSLSEDCRKILLARMELWKKVKPDLPSSLQEVAHLVSASPAANYFLIIFFIFVSFIFIGGLCFGRITKRIKRDLKDR